MVWKSIQDVFEFPGMRNVSLSSADGVEEVDYASLLHVEIEETADMRAQFYLL